MALETNVNYSVITQNMEMNLGVPKIGFVMELTVRVQSRNKASEDFLLVSTKVMKMPC